MRTLFLAAAVLLISGSLYAGEVRLNNGDHITGEIIERDERQIKIKTQAMGTVTIDRKYIKPEEPKPAAADKENLWKKSVALGYVQSGGNTEKSQGNLELNASRKTDIDEWTFKYTAFYSSSQNQIDGKKFTGLGRYAYSFGEGTKWYHFYKIEGDQDVFANVEYRITPSTGVGYWWSDEEDYKLMSEMALGFEHTSYRDTTDSDNEAILIPRAYFEKKLIEQLRFKEDITIYPSLSEFGDYRLTSETALINPITDRMNLKISMINDYDSNPPPTTEKHDYRIITSIDYTF